MIARRPRFSFTATLLVAFTVLFAAAMAVAILAYWCAGSAAALAEAEARVARAAADLADRLALALRPAFAEAHLEGLRGAETEGISLRAAPLALLSIEPAALSVAIVERDGTLHAALRADKLAPLFAWPEAALALRHVPPGLADTVVAETWRFLSAEGEELATVLRSRARPTASAPSISPALSSCSRAWSRSHALPSPWTG